MSGISICPVIHLVRVEDLMHCCSYFIDVFDICSSFLCGELRNLADMLLVRDNDTSRMALLLEQIYLAALKLADFDSECCNQFTFHTICTVLIYHCVLSSSFLFSE